MAMEEKTRRGLHLFSRRTAPFVKDTGAQRPPEMDDAGREAVPELYAGAGTVTKLLYGDPDGPDDCLNDLPAAQQSRGHPVRHCDPADADPGGPLHPRPAGLRRQRPARLAKGAGLSILAA